MMDLSSVGQLASCCTTFCNLLRMPWMMANWIATHHAQRAFEVAACDLQHLPCAGEVFCRLLALQKQQRRLATHEQRRPLHLACEAGYLEAVVTMLRVGGAAPAQFTRTVVGRAVH